MGCQSADALVLPYTYHSYRLPFFASIQASRAGVSFPWFRTRSETIGYRISFLIIFPPPRSSPTPRLPGRLPGIGRNSGVAALTPNNCHPVAQVKRVRGMLAWGAGRCKGGHAILSPPRINHFFACLGRSRCQTVPRVVLDETDPMEDCPRAPAEAPGWCEPAHHFSCV